MRDIVINTSKASLARLRCERGQTLVEYGLILMFVSITALALTPLGQWVALRLTNLAVAI
jgi:Flp pilus assembly pilin Flp